MNEDAAKSAPQIKAPPFGRRLRYFLEAAGFFLVIGFFRLFPIDTASAIGGWIGRTVLAPTGLSKPARRNLAAAYPELSDAERETILLAMWNNLGRVLAEYGHLSKIHWRDSSSRIEITGLEHVQDATARGRGVLMISGHFANWEILAFGARDYGFTGGAVVRPTNNPYVYAFLERLRTKNGFADQIAKGPQGTKRIFTILRRNGAVCMLVDQRASEGIPAPFFGRDAMTTPVPAAFALKLGAVILPVSNERLDGARFRITVHPIIEPAQTGDPDRDLLETTAAITAFVEARIRENPSQWLWLHRRWNDPGANMHKRAKALAKKS